MTRLVGYGLTIESELPVPGAVAPNLTDQKTPDLCIRLVSPAGPAAAQPPGFARTEDGLVCFVPGVATYRCRPDAIGVAPLPAASPGDVAALLVASALPAVLWMRGAFVLHAAAACWPGGRGALAIAGRSGAGKSTIVEQLLELGALLVGDDSLAIEARTAPPLARGLPGAVRRAQAGGGSEFRAIDAEQPCLGAPLAAVLVLTEADSAWSIERVAGVEAARRLLANRHRPRAALLAGRAADNLADCTRLVAGVPVYVWRRPRGRPELDPGEREMLTAWLANSKEPPSRFGGAMTSGSGPRSRTGS